MSAMLDHIVAQLVGLHVRLLNCRERLAADTDSEALHDLRTTTRRLRSLIRPLRDVPGIDRLEDAARDLGQLTTPMRDREVLHAHLLDHAIDVASSPDQSPAAAFAQVANAHELQRLLDVLDAAPGFVRAAHRQGLLAKPKALVDKRLRKQWRKLGEALEDPAHDRHRLRLLIKRVRYGDEAFAQLQHAGKRLRGLLKDAQGDLGDWHDRLQWLQQIQQRPELMAHQARWQAELKSLEAHSDGTLERLYKALRQPRH